MSSPLRPVKVQVAGQTLALRTDASAAYMRELAAMVDRRLAIVREREGTQRRVVSTQALALLCALQLADELRQAEDQAKTLRREVRARTERILAHVESLDAPAPARRKSRARGAAEVRTR